MLCIKAPNVAALVAFLCVLMVVSTEAHNSQPRPTSVHKDVVSPERIIKLLGSSSEREMLSLTVDQVPFKRPDPVPQCLYKGHLYDATARLCAEPGTEAHCGDNMICIPAARSSHLGACACFSAYALNCWGRPGVLAGHHSCYYISEQGPCNVDETVVPISKFRWKCGPDACLNTIPENAVNFSQGSPVFNFTFKGKCFTTESQGFCSRGQVMRFITPYKIPSCVDPAKIFCQDPPWASMQEVVLRDCEPGTVANPTSRVCQPVEEFDFE